jgi:hypothetical protein
VSEPRGGCPTQPTKTARPADNKRPARPLWTTVSIHADPDVEFPYFSGRREERGRGDGVGFNLNIPLPLEASLKGQGQGVSEELYLGALAEATAAVRAFGPDVLLVSAGLDTFKDDVVGGFDLQVCEMPPPAAPPPGDRVRPSKPTLYTSVLVNYYT